MKKLMTDKQIKTLMIATHVAKSAQELIIITGQDDAKTKKAKALIEMFKAQETELAKPNPNPFVMVAMMAQIETIMAQPTVPFASGGIVREVVEVNTTEKVITK